MFIMLAATAPDPTVLQTLGGYAWNILSVGAGLTFVIFVHELGHFLVAKACGVKCEKFYVGFDFFEFKLGPIKIPRALVKFQWGETEYGLGSLPLGGYVKMLGQDDDPRNAQAEAARIRGGDSDKARAEAIASGLAAEGLVPGKSVEEATEAAAAAELAAPHHGPDAPVPAKTVTGHTVLLDPRSYPAKSVPARMAIISAGVIMNLIFAVILAAAAFSMGVPEVPAVIGIIAPGSPAWEAGIQPGSQIRQIGKSGSPYDHMRFSDVTPAVVLNGYDRDIPFLLRGPDGQDKWFDLSPSNRLKKSQSRPSVGIGPESDTATRLPDPLFAFLGPTTTPALADKDRVTVLAGEKVTSGTDIQTILARQPNGPLTMTVERSAADEKRAAGAKSPPPKSLEITVQPKPMRELGLAMEIGPLVAVRKGSPADEAGFEVGDVIEEVNGEPVGDPMSLPQRLTPTSTTPDPITFKIRRKDRTGKPVTRELVAQPEPPHMFHDSFWLGGPTAVESIGIAYPVTNKVAAVAENSPAAKARIQAGDVIQSLEVVRRGGDLNEAEELVKDEFNAAIKADPFKPIELDDNTKSWTFAHTLLQNILPQSEVKLTWKREGKPQSATLQPQDSTTFFDASRGLIFFPHVVTRRAGSFSEAFALGYRETWERLKQVVLTLRSLIMRDVSATNLSGPFGIIAAAGSFASEGLPMLLIFLTMLSANLAILNFLPIPALDGGHMLFLTAEAIRGKPVDEQLQMRLTVVGVLCLLGLMVFATAMDLGRFATWVQQIFS